MIVGFLLVGYAQAVDHRWVLFGVGLGVFGAIVTAGFFVLDIRNEGGRCAGRKRAPAFWSRTDFSLTDRDKERLTLPNAISCKPEPGRLSKRVAPKAALVVKHKIWLRLIIFFAGVGFFAAAVWACSDYSGSGSDPVACRKSTVFVLHRPGLDLNLVRRSEQADAHVGNGDDSGRPSQGSSGETQVGSKAGTESKLTEAGPNCDAKSTGGDSPEP